MTEWMLHKDTRQDESASLPGRAPTALGAGPGPAAALPPRAGGKAARRPEHQGARPGRVGWVKNLAICLSRRHPTGLASLPQYCWASVN